ncbi:MAG: FeoB-associated Cys-rich membrane protein [Eubacteriales bacterium]|nr:FeoB-associated Cys-rich membrane protein [Eubacteriales bacterium]
MALNGADLLILLILAALIVLTICYLIREKRLGHKSCGFDCSTCSGTCSAEKVYRDLQRMKKKEQRKAARAQRRSAKNVLDRM